MDKHIVGAGGGFLTLLFCLKPYRYKPGMAGKCLQLTIENNKHKIFHFQTIGLN